MIPHLIALCLTAGAPAPPQKLVGIAVCYTVQSNGGRTTASGIPLSDRKPSAASRRFPLRTVVRVTSLHDGRSLVLRVTDRGPYPEKIKRPLVRERAGLYLFDLSKAAYDALRPRDGAELWVKAEVVR